MMSEVSVGGWVSVVDYMVSSIKLDYCSMFQNSYQNGTYFQVLDLKNSQDKLKTLYKSTNVVGNNKVFDKELKTFVLEFNAAHSKLQLPKDDKKDLYLIQQYLVLQIYFFPGAPWLIEFSLSDLTKTKRRVILSPNSHKLEVKPFFVKAPCQACTDGTWNNLTIDLYSYMEAFKGQTYRSLDSISLTGQFKLRRIYTSATQPIDCSLEGESEQAKQINFLPKNYYFPPGVVHASHLISFQPDYHQENASEATEHTVKQAPSKSKAKGGANLPRLQKNESVKTEKQIREHDVRFSSSKKKKDFLANTNGTQAIARNRKQEEGSSNEIRQDNVSSNYSNHNYSKSVDKTKKKKQLTKTQEIPPKPRSNLEGYNVVPKKSKELAKNKVNPWRNTKLPAGYTDTSQLQVSKDERNTETAQTTSMLKTKNIHSRFTDKNAGFDKRSDQYSENEYVELSQKFSTLTDGKFFKNELTANQDHNNKNQEDEIEENIEMETGSVHSLAREEQPGVVDHEPIKESINDSLDGFGGREKIEEKLEGVGRSSLYGFGEQLMRKFMGEIQRPYSPPVGQKEQTEQSLTERGEVREQVQLLYDPVLNCYYDHKTHTYYQLKN